MKTPREILLERHQAAEARLDRLRRDVLETELRQAQPRAERPSPPRRGSLPDWLTLLWEELVQPCRRAWVGLAAAWVLIAALHWTAGGNRLVWPPDAATPPSEVMAQLQEQRLLRAELLGAIRDESAEPASFVPRPRSGRGPTLELDFRTGCGMNHWQLCVEAA